MLLQLWLIAAMAFANEDRDCAVEIAGTVNELVQEGQQASAGAIHPVAGRVDDKVAIYWYPKAGYVVISHTELQVDEAVWTGQVFYGKKPYSATKAKEKALKDGRSYGHAQAGIFTDS
jgi:hypothetical protein